jgi:hypothetical protein
MACVLECVSQGCPDASTAHDHEVRHPCLLQLSCCPVRLYRRNPAMTSRVNQTNFVWC